MRKVFLYLYPIEEYAKMFLFSDDSIYDELGIKRPLPILNKTIQERYRNNGYEVFFALYPDKETYGIELDVKDKIIYTDVSFSESSGVDENKNIKKNFIPKYPNEVLLLSQLGDVDKLIIGGYHAQDCVKRVADVALDMGIDTLIDIDMTDLFFSLYKEEDYFNVEKYDPIRYKEYAYSLAKMYGETYIDEYFNKTYSSKAYGFNEEDKKQK